MLQCGLFGSLFGKRFGWFFEIATKLSAMLSQVSTTGFNNRFQLQERIAIGELVDKPAHPPVVIRLCSGSSQRVITAVHHFCRTGARQSQAPVLFKTSDYCNDCRSDLQEALLFGSGDISSLDIFKCLGSVFLA